jgi:hypothetical protein
MPLWASQAKPRKDPVDISLHHRGYRQPPERVDSLRTQNRVESHAVQIVCVLDVPEPFQPVVESRMSPIVKFFGGMGNDGEH